MHENYSQGILGPNIESTKNICVSPLDCVYTSIHSCIAQSIIHHSSIPNGELQLNNKEIDESPEKSEKHETKEEDNWPEETSSKVL